ncbi:hypothetical protein D3C72_1026140 [compost metagenome]
MSGNRVEPCSGNTRLTQRTERLLALNPPKGGVQAFKELNTPPKPRGQCGASARVALPINKLLQSSNDLSAASQGFAKDNSQRLVGRVIEVLEHTGHIKIQHLTTRIRRLEVIEQRGSRRVLQGTTQGLAINTTQLMRWS